jgi:putative ABC transport system ATP-binding protein
MIKRCGKRGGRQEVRDRRCAMGKGEVLIRAEEITKDYPMGEVTVHALRETSLDVLDGELLVVLGPSGSGKSTLLNIVGGMEVPSSGRVVFRGADISAYSQEDLTRYRREHVGFVFQFFNLVSNLTALENVELACEISHTPLDTMEVLEQVGLAHRALHFPSQLSGGEQQRVAIARAVAKNPEVLLCDEPTGALDYETGKLILALLRKVNRETGKAVVLITHNVAIARMANRVVRLRSGRVVERITVENPLSPDEIEW